MGDALTDSRDCAGDLYLYLSIYLSSYLAIYLYIYLSIYHFVFILFTLFITYHFLGPEGTPYPHKVSIILQEIL